MSAKSKQSIIKARQDSLETVQALTENIDAAALKINILLRAIVDRIDLSGFGMSDEEMHTIAAIECFVSCARTSTDAINKMAAESLDVICGLARGPA
ncbi:hypothetical protein ACXX82_19540 [Glaciimonas sp. GNP009]